MLEVPDQPLDPPEESMRIESDPDEHRDYTAVDEMKAERVTA